MASDNPNPRCRILPLPGQQTAFLIDGREVTRWHFGESATRPFFYPLQGPSGSSLTRMGHPGAANHDHHRSVWFAHQKVLGIDFWSEHTDARIRQKEWRVYHDSDDEAVMAVEIDWLDGHDPRPLLHQELFATVRPGQDGGFFLELQSTVRPGAPAESLEFGKTNFGFLAVRVAKNISEHFGGGRITSSTGATGEPAIFGKPAAWMDYSGPVPGGGTEGITYFDHPANPGAPTSWHVRADGWMGASACRNAPLITTAEQPLQFRYLLHIHRGAIDADRAEQIAGEFLKRDGWRVVKSQRPHRQYDLERVRAESGD